MRLTLPLLLVGCTAEPVQLLDNTLWEPLPEGHPLAGEPCSNIAFEVEGAALELATEGCAPIALTQTLQEPLKEGKPLELVWWHDWLSAPEPADGVFQLYVDGALLYERTEIIPGPPAVYTEAFEAPVGGEEIVVRVSNHGANTWSLLRLTRL